jgi:replication initiator protein RepSA
LGAVSGPMLGAADRMRRGAWPPLTRFAASWTIGSKDDGPSKLRSARQVSPHDLRQPADEAVRRASGPPRPSAAQEAPPRSGSAPGAEVTRAGIRGKDARPSRCGGTARPAPSGRPGPARRKISLRIVGNTYTAPNGKTFRPSLFVTLTCPSYGRVGGDGTPVDSASYDYDRAARGALHFAALFDRFIQNLRRHLGYYVQYFAVIELKKRLAPHVHIAMHGTVAHAELRRVLAVMSERCDPHPAPGRRAGRRRVERGDRRAFFCC